MVILLFGPPGSGKGTQAKLLSAWLGVPSLSTGELLRAEVASGSPLGNKVAYTLASGELAGDGLVNSIVEERTSQPDCSKGFILDGYPRTLAQARFLDSLNERIGQPAAKALHLQVPMEALVARITARRQCPRCRRIYNLISQPPLREGLCDDHEVALITRDDDREDVLRARLRAYQSATAPVLAHYKGSNYLGVDGDRPPSVIFEEVRSLLTQ
jgi:adenylate kinase